VYVILSRQLTVFKENISVKVDEVCSASQIATIVGWSKMERLNKIQQNLYINILHKTRDFSKTVSLSFSVLSFVCGFPMVALKPSC
jgi:hypothetical protein